MVHTAKVVIARIAAALAFAVACLVLASSTAWADEASARAGDEYPDVMLAAFTNSDNDQTNSFYMSADGINWEQISTAFADLTPNGPGNRAYGSGTPSNPFYYGTHYRTWDLYSFNCPSIIYRNGYFWMLSNESNSGDDQTMRLVVSNSKDLVHWCDQKQVKVSMPGGFQDNGTPGQFDAVAADWAVGPDGNVYVVFSAGRYGAFHNDAENDQMWPYMIKITELSASNDPAENPMNNSDAAIRVHAEQAKPVQLPSYGFSSNRIDGSWYFEGGKAYLSIKKNGVTNEIWSIDDVNNCSTDSAWTLVNGNVVTGYEAPSLTKFNGTYYMLTDELSTWTPDSNVRPPHFATGVHVQTASSLSGAWSDPRMISATTASGVNMSKNDWNDEWNDGPRHGTVITVTDPEAKRVIWEARANVGWTSKLPGLPNSSGYSDVSDEDWFYQAVVYAKDNNIMTGVADGVFGAGETLNRSSLAVLLWRYIEPEQAAAYHNNEGNETGLGDVASNDWYTGAANWAVKEGIINGIADSAGVVYFGPGVTVTREMMVTMLVNRIKPDLSTTDYTRFDALKDSGSTSSWARESMAWAVEHGIINGTDDGRLEPGRGVLREEAAAIMMNVIESGIL